MQDSKLFKWIRLLPTQEQNDFLRFVEHAGGKNRQELHGLLSHFLEDVVRGKGSDRESFYKKWRPDSDYDVNYLRKRMTRLQELFDSFLAAQELALHPADQVVFLAKALERRDWGQFIETERRDALKVLQAEPIDDQFFWQQLQLENAYLKLKLASERNVEGPSLQVPMNMVEELYLVQALRFACAARNQDRIIGTAHDYGFLPHVLPHITERITHMNPLVRVYYRVHQMHEEHGSSQHYDAFMADLATYTGMFAPTILRELYQYAINHCVSRLNAREMEFAPRLSELYNDLLNKGILLRNGYIAGDELKNMIGLSARIGQLEVAEELLERYKPLLSPDADPAVANYCKLVIHYYKGEFAQVRRECENVLKDTKDTFYESDARIYYLRACYEMKDFDFVDSQYDAFRMFLRRVRQIGKTRIQRYQGFLLYFNRLYRIMQDHSTLNAAKKKLLETLSQDLDEAKNVADAPWLKDKITQALRGL